MTPYRRSPPSDSSAVEPFRRHTDRADMPPIRHTPSLPRRLPLLLLLLFACSALALGGCRKSNRPYVLTQLDEFFFEVDFNNSTEVDIYEWRTTFDRAQVSFNAHNFSGLLRLEIFDDRGEQVYDEFYDGHGGHEQDFRLTDDQGADGEWQISITTGDVDGRVTVFIEPF